MAKKVEKESDEIRDLSNLEEKAGEGSGNVGPEAVIGQRDEESEVSLVKVYVNPALRGDVEVFDDASGKQRILSPGVAYELDPKTAEKKYHDTPLFVAADE